jgi:3-oxoacyl-[acyl-carrier-protein] synthase II
MSGDAHHITAPPEDGSGAVRVMRATLRDAGIAPEDVDYINAHGTSTLPNDRIETLAVKKVFAAHAYKVAISSTKSMTGHGAARRTRASITVCDPRPESTINLENADPD